MLEGTWPPAYDSEELENSISNLTARGIDASDFYVASSPSTPPRQGDIIRLASGVPIVDDECEPSVVDGLSDYWMLLGNTCDIDRNVTDVPYTLIAPIAILTGVDEPTLKVFRQYSYYRRFYLPAWNDESDPGAAVDFTMQVTLDKTTLGGCATHVASLTYCSWVLLNACLTRFTARSDGRHT